jgi:hypothetical protein
MVDIPGMALLDQANLAADTTFIARVQMAIVTAALQIVGEDPGSDVDVSYRRQSLGINVLGDPAGHAARFAWAVASNPVITADATDSDIAYTITTIWSDLAGVVSVPMPGGVPAAQ